MTEREIIEYVRLISNSLELRENTALRAIDLANRSIEAYLTSGKKSEGIAAATIYIACILEDDRRTQKEISRVAKVPESTIRNQYLEIARGLEIKKDKK